MLHGQVQVVDRLGLHPLHRINHQQGALTGGQAAADLIMEIDVSRRIDQVQGVGTPAGRVVVHADGMALDGDATLALDIHRIEGLFLQLLALEGPGLLQQPIGQGAFPMVNVGYDAEVAGFIAVQGHIRC